MRSFITSFFLFFMAMGHAEEKFDLNTYTAASMEGLRIQTEAHQDIWGIGSSARWNVDQDTGLIWWILPDGKTASAPVQIIGTYNPADSSFMWGWDHPSVSPPLQEHAKLIKAFGEKHGIPKLTTRVIKVTENEAWEFVAIANRLAEANGGYRADAGGPIVFMTFGKISLKKSSP